MSQEKEKEEEREKNPKLEEVEFIGGKGGGKRGTDMMLDGKEKET